MTEKKKVLIIDDMHASITKMFEEINYDVSYQPDIKRDGILDIIHGYEGMIVRSKTSVDKELIDKASKLEFVARAGSGMDKVDIELLEERGITAINAPEGNRDALAEHTLGMLLNLLHNIHRSFNEVKRAIWDREGNRGRELKKKVVGIYGVGYMGMAFAKKLMGLGCEVIGYDKFKSDFSTEYIREVTLEELKEQTEILSIHLPLTEETRYLFDMDYLSAFKNLKILINTARGRIVKASDLIELLEGGRLFGAALDVLENEKLNTYTIEEKTNLDKLVSLPNVIVTPHIGGWTFESYERINKVIIDKLKEATNS